MAQAVPLALTIRRMKHQLVVVVAAALACATLVAGQAPPAQDAGAVKAMTARGLTVTPLDAKARAEFQAAAEKLVASARGTMVPEDVFNQAIQERDAFRKTKK